MEKVVLSVPGMYGDHHVLAVRDILGKLPGVENVLATSAFKQVVVWYDSAKAQPADFEKMLSAEGYMNENAWPDITDEVKGKQHGGSQFVVASGIAESVRFEAPPVNWGAGGPRPCPGFEFRTFAGGVHPGDE